ncbi:MAG: Maf family protein [Bacteroidota bacterium]
MKTSSVPQRFRKIILGSGSPRRKQLLEGLGWPVRVVKKDVDETIQPGLERGLIPMQLAEKKAMAFDGEMENEVLLITADTIVWLDGAVLGKPVDEQEAKKMLFSLQGKTHQVYTGVCLTLNGQRHCFSVKTDVTFFSMNENKIMDYIRHYRPFDKAGSYGAQEGLPDGLNPLSDKERDFLLDMGKPDLFEQSVAADKNKRVDIIRRIDGSYFNVMGLPLAELWDELQKFGEITK